jgi:hypothetical protein
MTHVSLVRSTVLNSPPSLFSIQNIIWPASYLLHEVAYRLDWLWSSALRYNIHERKYLRQQMAFLVILNSFLTLMFIYFGQNPFVTKRSLSTQSTVLHGQKHFDAFDEIIAIWRILEQALTKSTFCLLCELFARWAIFFRKLLTCFYFVLSKSNACIKKTNKLTK